MTDKALTSSDPNALNLRVEPLGRANLTTLRRGVIAATLGAAVVSTFAYAGQERGRLAAIARPPLVVTERGPSRSALAEMVGADARLFVSSAPIR